VQCTLCEARSVLHTSEEDTNFIPLFDHLICLVQHGQWNRQANLSRCEEVEDQIQLIDGLHREVLGVGASENTLNISRRRMAGSLVAHTVTGEAPLGHETTFVVHCCYALRPRCVDDQLCLVRGNHS